MTDEPSDLANLIPVAEVPDHLPRHRGKKTNIATIYRWIFTGKLPATRIMGRLYIAPAALQALAKQLDAGQKINVPTARQRTAGQKWAEDVLKKAGLG